jgi:hypothetical protein
VLPPARLQALSPNPPYPRAHPHPIALLLPKLQDGRIFEGRLVSYDTVSDLAVLKVESDALLPAARLGEGAGGGSGRGRAERRHV